MWVNYRASSSFSLTDNLHRYGFSRDELITYRTTMYRNLVDSAQAIILAVAQTQRRLRNTAQLGKPPNPSHKRIHKDSPVLLDEL